MFVPPAVLDRLGTSIDVGGCVEVITTDVHTTLPSGKVEENADVYTSGMGVTTVGTSGVLEDDEGP